MNKGDIKEGGLYRARVGADVVTVRVRHVRPDPPAACGWSRRPRTVYDVEVLATGRRLTFRSARKFREGVSAGEGGDPAEDTLTRRVYKTLVLPEADTLMDPNSDVHRLAMEMIRDVYDSSPQEDRPPEQS